MTYFPFELVKVYQQERVKEAEHYRQIEQIRVVEPSFLDCCFSKSCDALVDAGRKSKEPVKQILAALSKVEIRFEGWFRHRLSH